MSYFKLDNVSLDYIVRTGSNSLKTTCFKLTQKLFCNNKDNLLHSSYRALSNINLDIKNGTRLALIGRNGSGKSSLLKVLAQIYKPTIGKISTQGNISTLFNINIGLSEESTGYENIILMAIMRGYKKNEMTSLIKDVENFTELGKFLHYPVRTYSAGMRVKLSFAISTAVSTDIMLIDEIIGVGDNHFIHKAKNRIKNTLQKSDIIVLASHSNDILQEFCNVGLILDKGRVLFYGDIKDAIYKYKKL